MGRSQSLALAGKLNYLSETPSKFLQNLLLSLFFF